MKTRRNSYQYIELNILNTLFYLLFLNNIIV